MNTLPRAITAKVLADTITYYTLRHHWSDLLRSSRKHELRAVHHLVYLTLLGKDWRRGFTCPSNERKLENGAFDGWVLFRAMALLHMPSRESEILAPFDGLVTPEMLQQIRQLVPVLHAYNYKPFPASAYPFEAYNVAANANA